jgi:hypothetical protein
MFSNIKVMAKPTIEWANIKIYFTIYVSLLLNCGGLKPSAIHKDKWVSSAFGEPNPACIIQSVCEVFRVELSIAKQMIAKLLQPIIK